MDDGRTGRVSDSSRRRASKAAAALAAVALVVGCAAEPARDAVRPGGSTPTTESAPPEVPHARAVSPITVAVDDPEVGSLTFDGLAAGDPASASSGRLVVLLHGFPESAEAYRDVLPGLAADGWYAVAYSQRGYSPGARPEPVEAYALGGLVRDLFAVAGSLGAPTFHVVGHDWGGAVAWLAAAAQPETVTTLTALSTPHPDAMVAGIEDPADPQRDASAYMTALRREGAEDALLVDGATTFRTTFGPDGGGLPADKVDVYADLLATPPALRAALNWYRANPLPPPARLGPVRVPTLYLWGDADGAFARSSATRTASFVEAPYTFVELAGQGHWLPELAPEQVLEHLRPHLVTGADA